MKIVLRNTAWMTPVYASRQIIRDGEVVGYVISRMSTTRGYSSRHLVRALPTDPSKEGPEDGVVLYRADSLKKARDWIKENMA